MSTVGDILRSKQPEIYKFLRWRYPEPDREEDKRGYKDTAKEMRHDKYKREHGAVRQT